MKALLLSGGMGKRLRPITDYLPKSLVPIDNTPIIEWQIRYFKKFGIREFVICAGYRADQITHYLDSKNLGVEIEYSIEKTPLGTGGAIKNAQHYLDVDSFFVINGDVITSLDINKLKIYRNSIAVIPLRTSFGLVHLNDNKVQKFEEKPEIFDHWMNAGVYHLSSNILKYLPRVGNIEGTTFPTLSKNGSLNAIQYTGVFWHSIDSHKDIEECNIGMKALRYRRFLAVK
ncbi:MAG: nucleotidyltransferase family protein [Thaumarchaeota archaeon]|nr:MAG: nucleotidyltransferase family protein [Nitrososphaerota archaeon]